MHYTVYSLGNQSNIAAKRFNKGFQVSGGDKRDRTADLLHAMQALSQLSYTPLRINSSAQKEAL
jgi:hypothetical protein